MLDLTAECYEKEFIYMIFRLFSWLVVWLGFVVYQRL